MNSPYAPPKARVSDVETLPTEVEYGGFWRRVGAAAVDSLIVMVITVPLLLWVYGSGHFIKQEVVFISGPAEFLISYVFPIVATVLFWKYRAATPGKMLMGLKVVKASDFGPISTGQAIGRYFAYVPSTLVFGLGLLWVAFDGRKQGWHDKMASTVVIRS